MPPVGKSGPLMYFSTSLPSKLSTPISIAAQIASFISVRLWGAIVVDIPTAIPAAPFINNNGSFAGK